jgi:co-chaperonin GroES (HSP10)
MSNTYDMLLVPEDRIDDIEPLDDQLVVKIAFPPAKTKGGIIVTNSVVKRELAGRIIGTVLKCGPNVEFFKPGEECIFAKYAGTVVSQRDESKEGADDGYEIRIMEEKYIISKLKKKEQ